MRKFRFQFSLRMLFIFSFVCAIICAFMKCKKDAENNFLSTSHVVHEALNRIEPEIDEELYNSWLDETKTNPTFPDFTKHYSAEKDRISVVVKNNNSHVDCFGLTDIFFIRRRVLSPKTDFSQKISENDIDKSDVIAIDFAITGPRYYGILSQKTTISIHSLQIPQNGLLLSRLKAELDKAGLAYEIKEIKLEDWYRPY